MASQIGGLKPTHLWRRFEDILKIPHGSGNERAFR